MRAARGEAPAPLKSPIRAVKDAIEYNKSKQKAQENADMWAELDSYDGYTEEERKRIKKVN